jgi:hypothetical protein
LQAQAKQRPYHRAAHRSVEPKETERSLVSLNDIACALDPTVVTAPVSRRLIPDRHGSPPILADDDVTIARRRAGCRPRSPWRPLYGARAS